MNAYIQISNARANRDAKRIDRNPRRAAALKAVRAAIDAGLRACPPIPELRDGSIRMGETCPVTGLMHLDGAWLTHAEYGVDTAIDG